MDEPVSQNPKFDEAIKYLTALIGFLIFSGICWNFIFDYFKRLTTTVRYFYFSLFFLMLPLFLIHCIFKSPFRLISIGKSQFLTIIIWRYTSGIFILDVLSILIFFNVDWVSFWIYQVFFYLLIFINIFCVFCCSFLLRSSFKELYVLRWLQLWAWWHFN